MEFHEVGYITAYLIALVIVLIVPKPTVNY